MTRDDVPRLRDVPAAVGLLTRLPVRVNTALATQRGARAAWAYSLAGLSVALIAGALGTILLWLGIPANLGAGLVLATLVVTTGALHEDGLADTADGLWGGWHKDRRLDIMKDSRIGVYGVIALVIGLGLRWQALAHLIEGGALWSALIVTAMLSRAAMLPLMCALPHARDTGLSHSVGRPSVFTTAVGLALAGGAGCMTFGSSGFVLIGIAALCTLACGVVARAKIGGQTGDILGATQQISEIACLITLVVLLR